MAYTNKPLHVIYGDGTLGIGGERFHYLFSYERGGLESLVVDHKEWLYRTPRPVFWRATTDNDHGSGFAVKAAQWYAADRFSTCQKITVEVDDQVLDPLPIAPLNNRYSNAEFADHVTISTLYQTSTVPSTTVTIRYTVVANGQITVAVHYAGQTGLPELPAFGLRLIMPTLATGFNYRGLSGETYPDRLAGARRGDFHVTGLPVTPYLVPQECGMHMATETLTVTRATTQNNADRDSKPFSLTFNANERPFAFSCLPYTAAELENATHQEELPPARRTVLTIFGAVRGVGGIDSWGTDVEAAYHVPSDQDIDFSFNIQLP